MHACVAAIVVALALLAACGSQPDGSASADGPGRDIARDGAFVLTISTPRVLYASGEPIEIGATLTYVGPLETVAASGSGSGLVGFAIDELDGTRDQLPSATSDCAAYEFTRNEAMSVPFTKSGGYDLTEPDGQFWQQFFKDPQLRLPRGRWRISAVTDFTTPGGCQGEKHALRASVDLLVGP